MTFPFYYAAATVCYGMLCCVSPDFRLDDPDTAYIIRNRVQLSDLRNDAGLAVVFVLDYLLGLNSDLVGDVQVRVTKLLFTPSTDIHLAA